MKNSLAALCATLLVLSPLAPAQYRRAVPGYRFTLPRDHFDHPDFQTEWWYYTGNLTSSNRRHLGFELTFFRQAVSRDATPPAPWDVRDLYLAHLALTDLDGQRFYHTERLNRSGPGFAGINAAKARIWNGNWQVQWQGDDQQLQGISSHFQLQLTLHPLKPPVVHGENGVSQKAEGLGHASYYISLTRLAASGSVQLNGEQLSVTGLAWMDHEFFTEQLQPGQAGWDWLSLQLDDDSELMLFRLRRTDGSVDPFSAGTYIDPQGHCTHLRAGDFTLQPLPETWTSPATHATYPISWKITVPRLAISLQTYTRLAGQELATQHSFVPAYWEGAISLAGQKGSAPLSGVGYLEMTGYDHPVNLAP